MDPIYSIIIIILTIVLFSIVGLVMTIRKARRIARGAFHGREKLTPREFYECYFEQQGIPFYVVLQVREIFESGLNVDLSYLRPDDDNFWEGLSNIWDFTDPEFNEILSEIERKFDIEISREEAAAETGTLGKMINLVWQKIQEKENA